MKASCSSLPASFLLQTIVGGEEEPSKEEARQRFLENEIHKTSLKMTEVGGRKS